MPPSKRGRATAAKSKRPSSRTGRSRQLARQRARRSMRRRLVAAGLLAAVVAAVLAVTAFRTEGGVVAELEARGCEYDADLSADPPAGGDAADQAAEPGFYARGDDPPPDAALVKAMRRGFTVLWYGDGADQATLDGLSDRFGRELIVVPRPGADEPYVVTAWERRLRCDQPDDAAIARFVESFRDGGPEKGFL